MGWWKALNATILSIPLASAAFNAHSYFMRGARFLSHRRLGQFAKRIHCLNRLLQFIAEQLKLSDDLQSALSKLDLDHYVWLCVRHRSLSFYP